MKRVLSRDQIRELDRYAIENCSVPGLILMENAGRGAAEIIFDRLPRPNARVAVVCGTGNNGGDGFVVARHLLAWGVDVSVCLVGEPSKIRGDARANYEAWTGLGNSTHIAWEPTQIDALAAVINGSDVLVDALFGTGLDRAIAEPFARVVSWINQHSGPCFALDLPSGLDSNTGAALGIAVRADETVTFGALKLGMLTPSGADHCGVLHVASLGIPNRIIDQTGHEAEVVTQADVCALLSRRSPSIHKHSAGNVLALAGSVGRLGASLLVAQGALRAGAGLVTIASWPSAIEALQSRVLEVMTARIDPGRLEASLDELAHGRHVAAIGPGLGTDDHARRAIEHMVLSWDGVKVVDADAISAFAGRARALAGCRGTLILTPHSGEMARLLGTTSSQVEANRFEAVREVVGTTGAIVVLKGANTVIGVHGRPLLINTTGSPNLATAGSGDVLCGIIAAMACCMPADDAAVAGVHIHALAGEAWQKEHGVDRGMLAGDIAQYVPRVLSGLLQNGRPVACLTRDRV